LHAHFPPPPHLLHCNPIGVFPLADKNLPVAYVLDSFIRHSYLGSKLARWAAKAVTFAYVAPPSNRSGTQSSHISRAIDTTDYHIQCNTRRRSSLYMTLPLLSVVSRARWEAYDDTSLSLSFFFLSFFLPFPPITYCIPAPGAGGHTATSTSSGQVV